MHTNQDLINAVNAYLEEHPAESPETLAQKTEISARMIRYFLAGQNNLTYEKALRLAEACGFHHVLVKDF